MGRSRAADALTRLGGPRTWAHVLRLVNFYGYAHVQQRRLLRAGPGLRMSPSVSMRNAERITLGKEAHVGERRVVTQGDSAAKSLLNCTAAGVPAKVVGQRPRYLALDGS